LDRKLVGKRIKGKRLQEGLTQSELAEKLDITYQQVQKYENGTVQIKYTRLVQIAKILKFDEAEFFEPAPSSNITGEHTPSYKPAKHSDETILVVSRDERALLKLLRKANNRKIISGITNLLKGTVELIKQ
jgi:transcriptional regulator with XRE-family HTH domain